MSIMEALGFPNQGQAKVHLLRAVREHGAVRLEADYSGGNDEGGVNDIRIFNAEGEALPAPDPTFQRDPRPGDSEWQIRDGKVSEYHPLWQAADDMLATEFGSWAGEFSAYGTLFADTVTGKVTREGEVQSGYDHEERDY